MKIMKLTSPGLLIGLLVQGILANPEQKNALRYHNDTSVNFINRWGFQEFCDHVYDMVTDKYFYPSDKNGVRFDPKIVRPGDVIFVRTIDTFMREVHPHIEVPYIIVTHGEQRETSHGYQMVYLEEEKIIAWFTIHPLREFHHKYYPIPLGIKPLPKNPKNRYYQRKEYNKYLKRLREQPKDTLVYLNFDDRTQHEERKLVRKLFAPTPYCLVTDERIPFDNYLEEMAQCKFVLSPRGAGPDCYRTWEALLVGSIPIVKRCMHENPYVMNREGCLLSNLDILYENLPVLIVDEWEDITEEFLHEKYQEFTSRSYDIAPLYLEYWHKKITEVRNEFLKKYT